jgi:hypothetical protein
MEMPEDDDGVEMKRAANRIISIGCWRLKHT